MPLNLQQLRYVVATADHGTMTRAASALHVAQPALSRAVRALERELGVTIFARQGRGIRLTDEGRAVVHHATRILQAVDELAAVGRTPGVARLVATAGQARELGSAAVAAALAPHRSRPRFRGQDPENGGENEVGVGLAAADAPVRLIVADGRDDVFDAVRAGRAELGLADLPAPSDLTAQSLGWQELVLVHPPGWDLPSPLPVRRLADLPMLSPPSDDWRRAALEDGLAAAGIVPHVCAVARDRDLVRMLVVDGAGATFSYGRQAEAARQAGAGCVSLVPPVVREVGAVWSTTPSGPVATLLDHLVRTAAALLLPHDDPRLTTAVRVAGSALVHRHPG